MRITFISPSPDMSGGTKVIAIHAQELMRRGHDVHIVSQPRRTITFGRKIKSLLRGRGWPRTPIASSHFDDRGLDHRVLERWRPVVDADVPDSDVVIATWWETAEWVSALSPRKGAKVYFIQGHEIFPYVPVDRARATYFLPLHKIVVSRWLLEIMASEYKDNVVDLVPNSIDRRQFFAPVRGKQGDPTAGFVYSGGSLKGVDVTLEALQIVRESVPDLRIICFGSHPMPTLLLPESAQFVLSPHQDRIRHLYAGCDVWLTASRSEGFNLPAMEAMSCRTPVAATRTGWPAEAVKSGHNGVLVDVDDVRGLARGVEWILSLSDEEWRGLSDCAFKSATAGSWEESTTMFERALEHACERAVRNEIAGDGRASIEHGPTVA